MNFRHLHRSLGQLPPNEVDRRLINLMPSLEVKPFGSGSPVPGAYAGSNVSISQLMYTASTLSLALSAASLAI